jgi:ketosteroid isomerase-like protein
MYLLLTLKPGRYLILKSTQYQSSGGTATVTNTLERTNRFLNAMEDADVEVLAAMLDQDVTWSTQMSATGGQDVEAIHGLDACGDRLMEIGGLMRSAKFADRRITVSADGTTSFVQSNGDFVTADGRPYRNVYVFRFDWVGDKILAWEEYANPVTVVKTFPEQYGHLFDEMRNGA